MKKILITLLIAGFATGLQAQIKPGKSANPGTEKQELELVWSVQGNWYPEKKFFVEIIIEKNMEKGNMVKFKASMPIEKVVVGAYEDITQPTESTTEYSAGTTTGIFFLDAPSYAGRKSYSLLFYTPGLQMSVWAAIINRKIILKIPKAIPKQIQRLKD